MRRTAFFVALLVAAACSDSTGPISPESAAIASAIAAAGALSGKAGGYASYAVAQLREHGRLTLAVPAGGTAEFDAVVLLLLYDARALGNPLDQGWFNGILAWNGLDTGAGSAEHVSLVGAEGSGDQALLTGSTGIGTYMDNRGGLAQHYVRTGPVFYVGTGGTYTVASADFDTQSRDCAPPADAPPPAITCRVATGRVSGTFEWTGDRATGTGPDTHTQSAVTFDLPAIRVSLTN
jgi:hypothetical protein